MQSSDLTSALRVPDLDGTTFPSAVAAQTSPTRSMTQRFVACDAELRLGTDRGCLAIGLYEARRVRAPLDPRLVILVVWRSAVLSPGVGRYRIEHRSPDGTFGASSYLTYGNEWRCLEASRATEGRIAIFAMSESRVTGAFDVTFASGRFHGSFLGHQGSRRVCLEPEATQRRDAEATP